MTETPHKITRQYLYDKGYSMALTAQYLFKLYDYEVSAETIRQICRGKRQPSQKLVELIEKLPRRIIC